MQNSKITLNPNDRTDFQRGYVLGHEDRTRHFCDEEFWYRQNGYTEDFLDGYRAAQLSLPLEDFR